jgi:hypothetical protein
VIREEGKTNRHDNIKEEKDQDQPQMIFVVPCPYCLLYKRIQQHYIREVAIKKEVVRHSIRKHPGSAVVAALQKAGFEYKEKDKQHLSEEKYYYDDYCRPAAVCVGGE